MDRQLMYLGIVSFVFAIALGINYADDNGFQKNSITAVESNLANHLSDHKENLNAKAIESLEKTVTTIESKISGIDRKMAVVEAKTDQPKTISTAPPPKKIEPSQTLNLAVGGNDPGIFKIAFDRGEIVYITGKPDDPISNMKFEIINPASRALFAKTFNTGSDGTFTQAFITDDKTVTGVYTAKFTWALGQTDFIKFSIK